MNEQTMTVKFWGVRGSHAVPGANTVRFGGNTPCVEVSAGEWTIILDAGTGIVCLGSDLLRRAAQAGQSVRAALFFSHLHQDHLQGFPFFGPAYAPSARLHLFGPGIYETTVEQALTETMSPPAFPVRLCETNSAKTFYNLLETDTVWLGEQVKVQSAQGGLSGEQRPAGAVCVKALRSYAHPGGVLIYRIEWNGVSVIYATDTEGYVHADRRLAAFARSADLLIHDAQYSDEHYCGIAAGLPSTQGWGHSTPRMACDLAEAAGVRRLVLFHHDPHYDDDAISELEAQARQRLPNAVAAYEGLEIRLGKVGNR